VRADFVPGMSACGMLTKSSARRHVGCRGSTGNDRRTVRSTRLADAVEKVRGIPLERNNRIIRVYFLDRTCALHPHFEPALLRAPPKSFFDSNDPIRTSTGAPGHQNGPPSRARHSIHPRSVEISFLNQSPILNRKGITLHHRSRPRLGPLAGRSTFA
jgi:hypothetical protein